MATGKWSQTFTEYKTIDDIRAKVDKLQKLFNKWYVVCVAITAGGAAMMTATGNLRIIAFGLFLALTGIINIAVLKLWAHTRLSMYRIVWEMQNQKEAHSS